LSDLTDRLIWAATKALRPIVKRLLEMGVPYGALETGLRELFVQVAESHLVSPTKRRTDSSIALVTGINRKEVKRIRSADSRLAMPRSFGINQATALISRWRSDPKTIDGRGRPLPLPYSSARGPSFTKLARKVTGDLAPRVLLNELVRSGAVQTSRDELLVLRTAAYVPKLKESGIQILGEDTGELAETILRNSLSDRGERLLQRKVYYDNLGSQAAARVRLRMRREGERFLRRIDRILSSYDRDRNPKAPDGERLYAALGVYFFESLQSASDTAASASLIQPKRARRRKRK
jgi:hypothetical protein